MEIYKQREYDVRNIIDDISCLSGLFENYVEEANKFIDYLLEDTKEINTLKQELQRKDNIINAIKEELNKNYNTYVCKNKSYGKIFKAGAEIYKEHLLYKIKELENDN